MKTTFYDRTQQQFVITHNASGVITEERYHIAEVRHIGKPAEERGGWVMMIELFERKTAGMPCKFRTFPTSKDACSAMFNAMAYDQHKLMQAIRRN